MSEPETNSSDGKVKLFYHFNDTKPELIRPHPDLAPVDKEAIRRELKASRMRHTTKVKSYLP